MDQTDQPDTMQNTSNDNDLLMDQTTTEQSDTMHNTSNNLDMDQTTTERSNTDTMQNNDDDHNSSDNMPTYNNPTVEMDDKNIPENIPEDTSIPIPSVVKVDKRKREAHTEEDWAAIQENRLKSFRAKQASKSQKLSDYEQLEKRVHYLEAFIASRNITIPDELTETVVSVKV